MELWDNAVGEIAAGRTRNGTLDASGTNNFWEPPPNPSSNVFDEIPRDDPTYQSISNTLIPHSRIPGLYLLKYLTFHQSVAYQPCSQYIDRMGLFDSLHALDWNGDQLFKTARGWSCIIQSIPWLPKDVRWVLATIYNFANEMLRPGIDENTLWKMRSWLLYWYEIADRLFDEYEIPVSAPEEDWFIRPTVVAAEETTAIAST